MYTFKKKKNFSHKKANTSFLKSAIYFILLSGVLLFAMMKRKSRECEGYSTLKVDNRKTRSQKVG